MLNNSLHTLAINESKINESISDDEISISEFHLIQRDRNRYGGEVLMYIRGTIPFSERNDLRTACSIEMLCVEIIRPSSRPFLVSSKIYLVNVTWKTKNYYLHMGDLNCDVRKFPLDAQTCKLQFLSCLYQLEQLS